MDTSDNGRLATVVISPPPTPNGPLHVGHLAGPYVAADVAVRAARRRGERTISVCGLDDNQNYVLAAARAAGTDPEQLRRHHARLIRDVLAKVRVQHDVFVEPATDPWYCSTVAGFLDDLVASGALPVQEWTAPACGPCGGTLHHAYVSGRCPCGEAASGGTCEACGSFLTAADLVDPRCTRCGGPAGATVAVCGPVLRLEDHRELLMRTWCRASLPPRVRRIIDRLLAGPLPTMPLTYPTDWGIALLGTQGHRLDVWAEMGLGYLCSVGRHLDPAAVSLADHVAAWREVGSLWAFLGIDNAFYYAVMFPALFGLAGLPPELLGGLVVNEFYTLSGAKFSTSRRHAVWAQDFLAEHDPGVVRAFLCWDAPQPHASDFTPAGYAEVTGAWPRPLRPVRTKAADLDRAERALAYPHFDPALAARCLLAGDHRRVPPTPSAPGSPAPADLPAPAGASDGNDRAAQLLAVLTGDPAVPAPAAVASGAVAGGAAAAGAGPPGNGGRP
ncbi:MAG TPA: class I tRNA ligase family protein [Micromonosporaceae bacterium]|nr:class I tRNA ligase family protein [Micromonosporaceae bacterium]